MNLVQKYVVPLTYIDEMYIAFEGDFFYVIVDY